MSMIEVVGVLLALAGGGVALLLLLFGLPGPWLLLALACVYAWASAFAQVGWGLLAWLTGLALAGEGLELWLSARATAALRPSWRVSIGAIAGSLIGALFGAPFLLGLGALLGALLGAFVGAGAAAASEGGSRDEIWATGVAALRGRFAGFVMKVALVVAMSASWLVAMFR